MLRLKILREEQNKTQAQVAETLKISRQVYANYENGVNQPSPQMLAVMADYFQCSVDYLIGRADDFGNITVLPYDVCGEILSSEERALVKDFRSLSKNYQSLLLEYITFLNEKDKK